jgi:Protein of unknown function (DUF2971)
MRLIVESRSLWATDIRYLSDAAELTHFLRTLHFVIQGREGMGDDPNGVLKQFDDWLAQRRPAARMVFAASFSTQGDLLSQWRAYCPEAGGVSLGFSFNALFSAAQAASFRVGRCIYDHAEQNELASEILDSILQFASEVGPEHDRAATDKYVHVFEQVEAQLLLVGALLKHPAYKEELEWRAVSPVLTDDRDPRIQYREGRSMLLPYLTLPIAVTGASVPIDTVFVGPTPHPDLATDAVSRFLSGNTILAGAFKSVVPYRTL